MDQYVQNLPESTQRQKLWRTNENRDERGEETNTPFGIQYLFRFEDFETDASSFSILETRTSRLETNHEP
jgi:hypothetical protein